MSFTSSRALVRIAVAARAVGMLGDQVIAVALVLQWQQRGAGAGPVAALMMANLAPILLLSGLAGRLLDRYPNRPMMVAASAVQLPAALALAFVTPLPAVLAVIALLGVGQAVNGAAWQALLPSLVPPAAVPRVLSLGQAANVAAMIVAPALAGVLFGRFGLRPAVVVDAATFALVLAAALLVPGRRLSTRPAKGGGLRVIAADPLMLAGMSLVALSCLLGSVVNVVQVFLVRSVLHAGPTGFGMAEAVQALGLLMGALLAGRLVGLKRQTCAFVLGAIGIDLGLVASGLAPSLGWLVVFMLVTGFANGVLNLCTSALVIGRAAVDERGRVAALFSGTIAGTQLAAYAAGGLLATVWSPRTIFVAAGMVGLLGPLLVGRRVLAAGGLGTVVAAGSTTSAGGPGRGDQADFSRGVRLVVSRGTSVG